MQRRKCRSVTKIHGEEGKIRLITKGKDSFNQVYLDRILLAFCDKKISLLLV